MVLAKEESFELAPAPFVRGSKLRKSFRIRHRYNSKLPPAAVLFMKSLEDNKVNKIESIRSKSIFPTTVEKIEDDPTNDMDDQCTDDMEPLIRKSPALRRRKSFKNLPGRKKLKMNNLISFFRK